MFIFIKGEIIKKNANSLIVQNQNLGYQIFVPINILQNHNSNQEIELWLHHHVKEDAETLYGFSDYTSLELFEKFLSINGIGPKVGMAIISQYPSGKLKEAIANDDVAAFAAIPGIGKKTAMRIIIELKNKLPEDEMPDNISNDVVEALKNLGYEHKDIKDLLADLPKDLSSAEEQIKWALKNIHR